MDLKATWTDTNFTHLQKFHQSHVLISLGFGKELGLKLGLGLGLKLGLGLGLKLGLGLGLGLGVVNQT